MNLTAENIILIGTILPLISVFAVKSSYRFGVPTLIFFLRISMLAGSERIGRIYFDYPIFVLSGNEKSLKKIYESLNIKV